MSRKVYPVSPIMVAFLMVIAFCSAVMVPSATHAAGDTCLEIGCVLDTQAPQGTVKINGGASLTRSSKVSVGTPATDSGSGVSHVRLSNSSAKVSGELRYHRTYSYQSPVSWDLADVATGGSKREGLRTVYVQWRDRAGNWSDIKSDTIILDFGLEEGRFFSLINDYRSARGLPTLNRSSILTNASRWMSADMGRHKYFSHVDSKGRRPSVRMAAFGYTYNTYKGENIGAGHTTADAVFKAWLNSPTHLAVIRDPNYRAIGIGRVYTSGSPYGWYWTTDFGGY